MYRGLLTGLNEAFVIDQESRDQFIAKSRDCNTIIKKLLAGQDLRPWHQQDRSTWLILIYDGMTAAECGSPTEAIAWKWLEEKFPPVAEHLVQFEAKCTNALIKDNFGGNCVPATITASSRVRKFCGRTFQSFLDFHGTLLGPF